MFQDLGLEGWTPQSAAVVLGLVLGLAFGMLAEPSRFCLRRGLAGDALERRSALGVWSMALAAAIIGTTAIVGLGLIDISQHRFLAGRLPIAAIILGGAMFGAGMVLGRGCASRLTVLAGTGNLRALSVLIVFAVLAHATLKGALAPARVWIGSFGVSIGSAASLSALPGGAPLVGAMFGAGLLVWALISRAPRRDLVLGGLIGILVPFGWLGTGYVLKDEFAPLPLETLAFTSAAAEGLFWWVAGTAVAPSFGVGLLGGVVFGSFATAALGRRLAWVGFGGDTPTGQYLAGGALMGIGGVLAGGCTVGAGLAGVSLLSVGALLALASIMMGAVAARSVMAGAGRGKAQVAMVGKS
ncbi:MAG: YeeE/YedE family protein [Hyphomicrobiaceae bacterium]